MIRNIICKLGIHSTVRKDKWIPSIHAPIITSFEQMHTCVNCGKVTNRVNLVWNGKEMVKVNA